MANVIFMKFNKNQTAIIADESTWHVGHVYGYRRTNYGDNLSLLTNNTDISKLKSIAIYAGNGFPSFHFEVINNAKEKLALLDKSCSVEELSSIVQKEYLNVHQRYINDKLNYLLSFDLNSLNSKKFFDKEKQKEMEILQSSLIDEAKKIIKYGIKDDAFEKIFGNGAAVLGYDEKNGVNSYYVGHDYKSIDFAYPLSSFGSGSTIVAKEYADIIRSKNLKERREGYSLLEGLYILLTVACKTKRNIGRMGGYFQMFIIDAENKNEKVKEFSDSSLHLLSEIVYAHTMNFIDKKDTMEFIERILINSEKDIDTLELDFYKKAKDIDKLRMLLFGFKINKFEEVAETVTSKKRGK
jgi:hypothetical protein